MASDIERAKRLFDTMQTPGWSDAMSILTDFADEASNEIFEMIAHSPDKLTGKTAIKYAARARALRDYKEAVESEIKLLLPTPRGAERKTQEYGGYPA